jgi:hypothetical protein
MITCRFARDCSGINPNPFFTVAEVKSLGFPGEPARRKYEPRPKI